MKSRPTVNSQVDKPLKLVPVYLQPVADKIRRIRVLSIGERCEVNEALREWSRSSPREAKSISKILNMLVQSSDLPRLKVIKRVGKAGSIIQIKADQSRLYLFQDTDHNYTLVCVETFWIGKGNKNAQQNKAIERAEELRRRWLAARPVVGTQDLREEE